MKNPWFWLYIPVADIWELHTPDYDPEVSIKLQRGKDQVLTSRFKATTMPVEIQEYILGSLVGSLDLWGLADKGFTQIDMDAGQVRQAAANTQRLAELLAAKKKLAEAKIIQE